VVNWKVSGRHSALQGLKYKYYPSIPCRLWMPLTPERLGCTLADLRNRTLLIANQSTRSVPMHCCRFLTKRDCRRSQVSWNQSLPDKTLSDLVHIYDVSEEPASSIWRADKIRRDYTKMIWIYVKVAPELGPWVILLNFYPEDGNSTFSETSLTISYTTRRHIPEGNNL
jgi:hypothetical protein